jgi:hypothetical protein
VKNEIKCADAFRMLTVAYGEATLDKSNVYRIGSWYSILIDNLGMRRVAAKVVPKLLNFDQKFAACTRLLGQKQQTNDTAATVFSQIWPPCDFFLIPKLKRPMKGRRYATIDEIKTAWKKELNKIQKNVF